MDERAFRKYHRKKLGKFGWVLLIYAFIMNVAVISVSLTDALIRLTQSGSGLRVDLVQQYLMESLWGNAWGYFIAAGIGFLILLLWKGKQFTLHEIWKTEKAMTVYDFLGLLGIFVFGQLLFQYLANLIEYVLNLFGLTAMSAMEMATGGPDTFSMFLYAGILAPITEEILFRGLILKSLQPYGKRFAIWGSAILFGLFHGNLVQTPFAFVVGLVLGYTASEYSLTWAMVLHMFNNLILSDMMTRLLQGVPGEIAMNISSGIIMALSAMGLILELIRMGEVRRYLTRNPIGKYQMKLFFTSFGMIVFVILMVLQMISGISFL